MTNKNRLDKLERQVKITTKPVWDLSKLTDEELNQIENIYIKIHAKQELTRAELSDLESIYNKAI